MSDYVPAGAGGLRLLRDGTLEFVSASRASAAEFPQTPLGRSLSMLRNDPRVTARITVANRTGLATVYNRAIAATAADWLVFVHDDVWLLDYYVADKIEAGLSRWDIVGIAGSTEPLPDHAQWLSGPPDTLSGSVAHGQPQSTMQVVRFGPAGRRCRLLDGVLIAARVDRLRERRVQFDERFQFHFYDIDFCRTADEEELTMATIDLVVCHESNGDGYLSDTWMTGFGRYREKWGVDA